MKKFFCKIMNPTFAFTPRKTTPWQHYITTITLFKFSSCIKARSHQGTFVGALLKREKFFPDFNLLLTTVIKIEKKENLGRRFCVAPLRSVLPEYYFRVARAEVSSALRCCERCTSSDLHMPPAPLCGYKLWRHCFSVIPL